MCSELPGGEIKRDIGPSAACNVAAIVKAYYVAALRDGSNPKLVENSRTAPLRRGRPLESAAAGKSACPKEGAAPTEIPGKSRRPSAVPEPGTTTARDVMIVTWLRRRPSYRWPVRASIPGSPRVRHHPVASGRIPFMLLAATTIPMGTGKSRTEAPQR